VESMNLNKMTIEQVILELMLAREWIDDYVYDEIPYVCVNGHWDCITNFLKKDKNVTRNV
jgi:hypothetical protein